MKLSKTQLKNRRNILDDETRSTADRVKAHLEIRNEMMNPDTRFNPDSFDPMKGVKNHDVIKRVRVAPPRRLPKPVGLLPKEILEGQMVGNYESKQDLYLLIAWLYERVSDLEDNSI